jgi:hypothetical protein
MPKSDSFPPIVVTKPLILDGVDFDFWLHRRETLCRELADHGIDGDLAKVVTDYCCDREVRPLTQTEVGVKHAIDFVMAPNRPRLMATAEEESRFLAATKNFKAMPTSTNYPEDAGELLSRELCFRLAELRTRNAPVRHGGHLARSIIAATAHCILEDLAEKQAGPGPYFLDLFAALLDLNATTDRDVFLFQKRKMAAEILAQDARLGTRKLARLLDVDAATILRWRREAKFQEEVRLKKEALAVRR